VQSELGLDPDEHRIALLLPENQGLEATGSYSGIRTRGGTNIVTYGTTLPTTNTGNNHTAIGNMALSANTTGWANTATGAQALATNETGSNNTAVGDSALLYSTTGSGNTAVGSQALRSNGTGLNNTAIGQSALNVNTGSGNTATGSTALFANEAGFNNTSTGYKALRANKTGSGNTAVGFETLHNNTTGYGNIAIGFRAGYNQTTGTLNIYLSHLGVVAESGTIRIGTPGSQTSAFIAGIRDVAVSGTPVVVSVGGQLGVQASSLRYKDDVRDMAEASRDLQRLRPVTFTYKAEVAGTDARHSREFGLIAEEVAEVYPELVVRDAEGRIMTVRYQELIPMLLNEVQKQNRRIEDQSAQIAELRAQVTRSKSPLRLSSDLMGGGMFKAALHG
jgi:hypothetical protein